MICIVYYSICHFFNKNDLFTDHILRYLIFLSLCSHNEDSGLLQSCVCVEVHLVFVITAMAAHFSCAMPQCKVAHMAGPPDCIDSRRGHHTSESCLLYRVMPWQQSITPQTLGSILSSQWVRPFTLLMKHSEKKLTVIIWDMPNSLFATLWWSPYKVSLRNSLKSTFPDATLLEEETEHSPYSCELHKGTT